jgi:hypothetical protein
MSRPSIRGGVKLSTESGQAQGDIKGKLSVLLYAVAVPMAFLERYVSYAIYVAVAVIWFIPDRRIERTLEHK